ncbi:MAG: DegQ family serine endoprotease [Candidatus Schekmanbacteria bacterium]|nr:MAG: DegQ family serine endoprotease [Candidatus Schekmanbacteria bacterium]
MEFRKKIILILLIIAVACIYFAGDIEFKQDIAKIENALGLKSASTGQKFWIEKEKKEKKAKPKEESHYFIPTTFADVADKVKDAVVNISTDRVIKTRRSGGFNPFKDSPFKDFFGDDFFDHFFGPDMPKEYRQQSLGSGFIINEDGYIVTNNHVVDKADKIRVKLSDGKEYTAEVIGKDAKTDIALIKIEPDHKLPVVTLGDSDKLRVGDWVIAIGNPFGLERTVTAGIVSAKERVIGAGPYDDFIQTDASINPGNSGGPLVDMEGNVVGINTAIFSPNGGFGSPGNIGIGFSIPINLAKNILIQLKEKGKVTRGWLGLLVQTLDENLAKQFGRESKEGALVGQVTKDSPAEKAGIKRGDIIIEFNGQKVKDSRDLSMKAASTPPGTKVKVKLVRDGKEKTVTVVLGEYPEEGVVSAKSKSTEEKIGITVENITPEIARQLDVTNTKGVVVSRVERGSTAYRAGIRRGDIIREVNRKPIENVDDFEREIGKADLAEGILFLIESKGMTHYVTIIEE